MTALDSGKSSAKDFSIGIAVTWNLPADLGASTAQDIASGGAWPLEGGGQLGRVMDHSGSARRPETPSREHNNQISELKARVAYLQHWSGGEHQQPIQKLRQLNFQQRLLTNYGQKQAALSFAKAVKT